MPYCYVFTDVAGTPHAMTGEAKSSPHAYQKELPPSMRYVGTASLPQQDVAGAIYHNNKLGKEALLPGSRAELKALMAVGFRIG